RRACRRGASGSRSRPAAASRALGSPQSWLHTFSLVCAVRMTPPAQTAQLWVCTSCGFVYDPAEGDPDGGVPPGTAFEEIPDDWFCPVCGARKTDFEPYED